MPSAASSSNDINSVIAQLESNLKHDSHDNSPQLLTRSKVVLLHANALIPSPSISPQLLAQAQHILELGALISIQLQDPAAFTRYYQQLQPFYDIPSHVSAEIQKHYTGQRSKITGLYLLLLLSQNDYAGFHTVLESLESAVAEARRLGSKVKSIEEDEFIKYPVLLESSLMEGAYDRVWAATRREKVPCAEFAVFSDILIHTIRSEVASCSEKAYSSIPVANAKNLLFLDSEGSVVDFGNGRGWSVEDGRVYFPRDDSTEARTDVLGISGQVIENALGYARELETIV